MAKPEFLLWLSIKNKKILVQKLRKQSEILGFLKDFKNKKNQPCLSGIK